MKAGIACQLNILLVEGGAVSCGGCVEKGCEGVVQYGGERTRIVAMGGVKGSITRA